MNEEKYIGYKPNISYTEDWSTDIGNYQYIDNNDAIYDDTTNEDTYIDNAKDKFEEINRLLYAPSFPNELKTSINEVYLPLIDTYNKYIKNQPLYMFNKKTLYIENGIESIPTYGVYLNYKTMSIKVGQEKRITAYAVPTTDKNNKIAEWVSSDNSIATVKDGIVMGISKGRVIIKAISTFDKECECMVDVLDENGNNNSSNDNNSNNNNDDSNNNNNNNNTIDNTEQQQDDDFIVHVNELSLDRTHILVKKNKTRQLFATIYPSNSYDKKIIWSSNNNNIATVSSYGVITGKSIGTCMITASSNDGNKWDTCFVTVIDDNINIEYDESDTPYDNDDKDKFENKPNPPKPPFSIEVPIPIIVVTPEVEPTPTVIESEFRKNLIDVIEYYNDTLKDILSKYYLTLIMHTHAKETKDVNFIYSDINISNKDIVNAYRHLLDSALRTEKFSNVKLSFLSNNFNFNHTLFHLKNFIVTYELRKKYYSIPYSDSVDRRVSESNEILKNTRAKYDLNYDRNYENLYRYLNSSLKNVSKIIEEYTQGIIAKSILTEKGGI